MSLWQHALIEILLYFTISIRYSQTYLIEVFHTRLYNTISMDSERIFIAVSLEIRCEIVGYFHYFQPNEMIRLDKIICEYDTVLGMMFAIWYDYFTE